MWKKLSKTQVEDPDASASKKHLYRQNGVKRKTTLQRQALFFVTGFACNKTCKNNVIKPFLTVPASHVLHTDTIAPLEAAPGGDLPRRNLFNIFEDASVMPLIPEDSRKWNNGDPWDSVWGFALFSINGVDCFGPAAIAPGALSSLGVWELVSKALVFEACTVSNFGRDVFAEAPPASTVLYRWGDMLYQILDLDCLHF